MTFDTRIRNTFRTNMAGSLIKEFDALSDSRYFLFFGKNSSWSNENRPDLVIDCVRADLDAWIDMIGCIRIAKEDVSYVVNRNPWQSGVIYTPYDDTINLENPFNPKKFYITTSENKIYKCIANDGTASNVQPTSISTSIFCTADGYKWKFMCQIPDDIYYKFATDTKVPIETIKDGISASGVRALQLSVQEAAIPGTIENTIMISLGDAFGNTRIIDNQYVAMPGRVGDTIVWVVPAGFSVGANLDGENGLIGYTIHSTSGYGSGQLYEISNAEWGLSNTSYAGLIGLTIKEPLVKPIAASTENRTAFHIIPTAKVYGDGIGCQLICKMESITGNCSETHQINHIEVLRPGKNYTNASIKIGPVSALAPVARAIISPKNGHGYDAVEELGASELMVFCSSRSGIAGDLTQLNNFRQFGLIRNPLLGRGINAGEYAGSDDIDGYKLRIRKPKTIVIKIKFWGSAVEGRHTYTPILGDFLPGQLVTQITTGATGRVVRWISPLSVNSGDCCQAVTGGDPTGYLYIEPLEDSVFRNNASNSISGVNETGSQPTPTYYHFHATNNFVPTIGYTSETFDKGKFVVGTETLTTARIVGWEVGTDTTDGYLVLSSINGWFRGPNIDSFGNFSDGERVVQVASLDPYSGIWNGDNVSTSGIKETNIGIVSNSLQREVFTRATYNQTYQINTTVVGNVPYLFDANGVSMLSLDSTLNVLQLITGTAGSVDAEYKKIGVASVVNYTITIVGNDNTQNVALELTSLRGWDRSFTPNEDGTLFGLGEDDEGKPHYLFSINAVPISETIPSMGERADVVAPDLQINSGEVVYIDHVQAIIRNPERLEEFKLILRF